MIRIRTLLLTTALTLAWALPAAAATWSPVTVLAGGLATGAGATPSVAIDDAGFGVMAWTQTVAGRSVVAVAQHAPGGMWVSIDPPLSNGSAGDACTPYASIDTKGNALVVWGQFDGGGCGSGNQAILYSTRSGGTGAWAAPVAVGTAAPQVESGLTASSNANGQIVIAWTATDLLSKFVDAAVGSTTGGFSAPVAAGVYALQNSLQFLSTGIGPAGDAAVQWTATSNGTATTAVSIKPAAGVFPTTQTNVITGANAGGVAVDGAGDVLSVYLSTSGASIAGKFRPAGGAFGSGQPIASAQNGFQVSSAAVGFDAAGNASTAWVETDPSTNQGGTRFTRRLWASNRGPGTSAPWANEVPMTDPVTSASPTTRIAVAATGAAVVSWDAAGAEEDAVAAYRPAGAAAYGHAANLGEGASESVAISPDGDALAAMRGSLSADVRVAVLDTQPPVVTTMTVPPTANTGASVAMTMSATDLWSGLLPVWSFGDAATAAGASTAHTYATAGSYTVTLTLTDGGGNAAAPLTRTITVAAAPATPSGPGTGGPGALPRATIAKPKLKAAYAGNRLVGTVALAGTSPKAGALQLVIRRSGAKKAASTTKLAVKVGKWSKTVKLPATLAPGAYTVTAGGTGFTSSSTSFTIAAPKSGFVDRSYASGQHRGPAVATTGSTSELWAHFHFGNLPKKGQAITTQWILPNGKKLSANTRPRTALVEAQVKDLTGKTLPTGRWRCVLKVGTTTLATVNVRLK